MPPYPLRHLSFLLGLLVLATTAFAQSFVATNLIDLGTLGGTSVARGINSSGVVVGQSQLTNIAPPRAFVWTSGGGMTDLGTLGGTISIANGINSSGEIAGRSTSAIGQNHAVLWASDRSMTDLGFYSTSAINSFGVVVGSSVNLGNVTASRWASNGSITFLGSLGGTNSNANAISNGNAIDNSAQVVGQSFLTNDIVTHAFHWTSGGGMVDLGTLGGTNSFANAINDSGVIVGRSQITGNTDTHAFLWAPVGGMIDLGTFGGSLSIANGINNSNMVVGQFNGSAFLWTSDTGYIDLNLTAANFLTGGSGPGFTKLVSAFALNDSGQIVGYGTYFDGVSSISQRAFLLNGTAIPEPATYAVIAGVSALVLVMFRRRRSAA